MRYRARMRGAADVETYLAALSPQQRAVLERLRTTIRSAVPDATEAISYRMPAFKLHGRGLVTYAAFKDHCSLFPMSKAVIAANADALGDRVSGEGTIRFTTDDPLPAALVRRIVKARVAELEARRRAGSGARGH